MPVTPKEELLPVGTRVRILVKRYVGREGTIVVVNHEVFDPERKQAKNLKWRDEHIEYGVNFGLTKDSSNKRVGDARAEAWFLPTEFELITNLPVS